MERETVAQHGMIVVREQRGEPERGEALAAVDRRRGGIPDVRHDDAGAGTGQHDVYLACTGRIGPLNSQGIWVTVSTDGTGTSWTNPPQALRARDGTNITLVNSPIIQVGPDHVVHAVWLERTGGQTNGTNWIKTCQLRDRGASLGEAHVVRQLVTDYFVNGNMFLKRSSTAEEGDYFNAWPFPVLALNPAKTNHLYVAYADRGTNAVDRADVFLVRSADGGTNWANPVRVNTDTTKNDQWMPVVVVKPDGTKLFLAWYDRRDDTNNSLTDVYGRFGAIAANGSVDFGEEFRISTVSFPPVFAGTRGENEPIYKEPGYYDPAYPPEFVNLHWWYSEWPDDSLILTSGSYRSHVGEYNGVAFDDQAVWLSWSDGRMRTAGTRGVRAQLDIRLIGVPWPE